ncbi:MAG: proteasome assembly chaperone family protein [Ancrocorticia sp.]|uniref:proteasome assembly chaperone family protein n=1 Tax=Ancrocorticia sp. TaxID=2593684 RepID=UPI003F908B42
MPNEKLPTDPIVILALNGWADAGASGSGLAEYIVDHYPGEELLRIDDDRYFNFQDVRPVQRMRAEGTEIDWPAVILHTVHLPDQDIVVGYGSEPSLNWRTFIKEFKDHILALNPSLVVTLGAQLVDIPHTRPFPWGVYGTDPQLIASHPKIEPLEYNGPTSALGVLCAELDSQQVPTAQAWVSVPHYVADPPNPKSELTLLEALHECFDLDIDTDGLPDAAGAWEEQITQLTGQSPEIGTYVSQLETAFDDEVEQVADSGHVVEEIEEFLRDLGKDNN